MQGDERRDRRQVRDICSLRPSTSLTTALGLLLEAGASSLPVVDEVRLLQRNLQFHTSTSGKSIVVEVSGLSLLPMYMQSDAYSWRSLLVAVTFCIQHSCKEGCSIAHPVPNMSSSEGG